MLSASTELQNRFIDTNGVRLRIAEYGEGPLVLLLHGFPGSAYAWRHQLPQLAAAGYRAVAPDQRGYGGSDCPERVDQYTLMHLVGDVVGLIDALDEKDAVIVGHDWGAPVAWASALIRPDIVRGVVGLSVPPCGPLLPIRRNQVPPIRELTNAFGEAFYMVSFQPEDESEKLLEHNVRASILGMHVGANAADADRAEFDENHRPDEREAELPAWLTAGDLDAYTRDYERSGFRGGVNWYRNIDRNWELLAPWNGATITPPSLFMIGDGDLVSEFLPIPESLDALREYLPAAHDLVSVPGSGHWAQEEQPQLVTDRVLEFLDSIGWAAGTRAAVQNA